MQPELLLRPKNPCAPAQGQSRQQPQAALTYPDQGPLASGPSSPASAPPLPPHPGPSLLQVVSTASPASGASVHSSPTWGRVWTGRSYIGSWGTAGLAKLPGGVGRAQHALSCLMMGSADTAGLNRFSSTFIPCSHFPCTHPADTPSSQMPRQREGGRQGRH